METLDSLVVDDIKSNDINNRLEIEERANHLPKLWSRQQPPEWRPRRASVASCQQHQRQMINHHQNHRSAYQFGFPISSKELINQSQRRYNRLFQINTKKEDCFVDQDQAALRSLGFKNRSQQRRQSSRESENNSEDEVKANCSSRDDKSEKKLGREGCDRIGSTAQHQQSIVRPNVASKSDLEKYSQHQLDFNNSCLINIAGRTSNLIKSADFEDSKHDTKGKVKSQHARELEAEQDTEEIERACSLIPSKNTCENITTNIITRKSTDLNRSSVNLCQCPSRRSSHDSSRDSSSNAKRLSGLYLYDQIQQISIARDLAMTRSINENLKLHEQQRKYLILSMALKQMLSNPVLSKKDQEVTLPSNATRNDHQRGDQGLCRNSSSVDEANGCRSRSCSFGPARSTDTVTNSARLMSRQVLSGSVADGRQDECNPNLKMIESNSYSQDTVSAAAATDLSETCENLQKHNNQTLLEKLSQPVADTSVSGQRKENHLHSKREISHDSDLKKTCESSPTSRHPVNGPSESTNTDIGTMRQLIISKSSDMTDRSTSPESGSYNDELGHDESEPSTDESGKQDDYEKADCNILPVRELGEWVDNQTRLIISKVIGQNNNNNNNNNNDNNKIFDTHARNRCDRRSQSLSQETSRNPVAPKIGSNEEISDECDINLEALVIESWLDDHPEFTHDYFVRKVNRQMVDDWLLAHAKVNNTNIISQIDLQSINSLSRPVSQLSLNGPPIRNSAGGLGSSPWRAAGAVVDVNVDEALEPNLTNYMSAGPLVLTGGRSTRSNSQSGNTAVGAHLNRSGAMTPVRKISATDFESRTGSGFLRPMLSTTPDGRLTFLTQHSLQQHPELINEETQKQQQQRSEQYRNNQYNHHQSKRKSSASSFTPANRTTGRDEKISIKCSSLNESKQAGAHIDTKNDQSDLLLHEKIANIGSDNLECGIDKINFGLDLESGVVGSLDVVEDEQLSGEVKLIFELVKNICDDLDIRTLLHKILKNIAVLINADRSSLFLVCGEPSDPNRHLVSQLFNVDQDSADVGELDDCIKIPWGTGLAGYVAESGEFVNIADCYNDPRFTSAIDQRTGYLTKHMLCAPIFDKRGEIVGVAQVINKRNGEPFNKSDEIKFKRYLQFCGIGLRNAQSYEYCQLENKRNQLLLDLARMVFEEQSSIEGVVYRIMLHTQSLLECERCQVLLIEDGDDEIDNLLRDFPNPSNNDTTQDTSSKDLNEEIDWRMQFKTDDQPTEDSQSQYVGSPQDGSVMRDDVKLSSKLFSLVFDLECDGDNDPVVYSCNVKSKKNPGLPEDNKRSGKNFPINIGITGYVAMTGETLNIEDAHEHERFDPGVDEGLNFKHRSILCMPIRNGGRHIIGVSQLINKKNGRPFNKNDEDLFEAFSIFCGLGIHNTLMYERVLKIMAKQRVTFEVLSYHATAPLEEAKKLNQEQIPSCFALNLASLKFNDFSLDDQYMLKSCLRFFLDLDLMRRFQIDQLVFCNWILSVQKNYRKVTYHPIVGGNGLTASPVRYHNWRHAFNVSQMMFAILVNTRICHALGELETLALLIACLCHDLDHRGTNNSFQIKSASPLAELYSTSTMEHHHFDQCVMILNSQGNQILANLTPEEYSRVIMLLEEAIIATDLANYFQKRDLFFQLVNSNKFDWQKNHEHRSLLRCMLMTACDVAAITKPWPVQKIVAELVMSEFYQQGDIERNELKLEPIDLMNRDKMNELPKMQLGFIDTICAPIYTAFAKLFPHELGLLLDGCLANRNLWTEMSNGNFVSDTSNIEHLFEGPNGNIGIEVLSSYHSSKSETELYAKYRNTINIVREDSFPNAGESNLTELVESVGLDHCDRCSKSVASFKEVETKKSVVQRMSI